MIQTFNSPPQKFCGGLFRHFDGGFPTLLHIFVVGEKLLYRFSVFY